MWNINFKCNEVTSYAQVKSQSSCFVEIDYFTKEVCHLFISQNSSSTVTVTAISIVVIVLLVVLCSVFYYIRHVRRKYRSLDVEDKSRVSVYLRVIISICYFICKLSSFFSYFRIVGYSPV